jgi:carboxylesterase
VHQFLRLQRHVHSLLERVHQPVLVIHSRQDHACPLANVSLLERTLRGHRRSVILEESYHVISVDVERERVAEEVVSFVEETCAAQAGAMADEDD